MKLIIFEDDKPFAERLKRYVTEKFGEAITVMLVTDNLKAVIEHAQRSSSPCIYLLDIVIHQADDGIGAAEEIYRQSKDNYIVIITQFREKILFHTYTKMRALNVILKERETFFVELSLTLQAILELEHERTLFIHNSYFSEIRIPIKDIIYIEAIKGEHKINIVHENGYYQIRLTLREILTRLDSRFIRCHNSYIVNIRKIKKVNYANRSITMENGDICAYSFLKRTRFLHALEKDRHTYD